SPGDIRPAFPSRDGGAKGSLAMALCGPETSGDKSGEAAGACKGGMREIGGPSSCAGAGAGAETVQMLSRTSAIAATASGIALRKARIREHLFHGRRGGRRVPKRQKYSAAEQQQCNHDN